jgi:membrane-associated phospholipid phosphatase
MRIKATMVAVVMWAALGMSPAAVGGVHPGVGVEAWMRVGLDAIASHRTNPPRAARALALLSVALDRAAREHGDRGSREAIDTAASDVLHYLYPDLALPAGRSVRGLKIARELIDRAQADGSDAVWSGTPPTGPGFWIPTPPAFAAPLEPLAGTWRTWNLLSGSEFRPGPPPAFGSPQFVAERDEVYAVSRTLTPEQRDIALFWADGAGTVTPSGHWNLIALDLIRSHGLDDDEAAHVLALLNTAQADAFIACWDAKFTYWSVRPVTAIRAALDDRWSPLIATPPFPSYPSGHSTTSGAASTVLGHVFPDEAATLAGLAAEAAASRLYGGIHYASDNAAGLALGRLVGAAALARYRS